MLRRYSELIRLKTFDERFEYLRLNGNVGEDIFGFDRFINQRFYKTKEWKDIRDRVIVRDNGCDLGIEELPIGNRILIHHMNPILVNDIIDQTDILLNPEYLICVSHSTHNALHYGSDIPEYEPVVRTKNDTCPWRKN